MSIMTNNYYTFVDDYDEILCIRARLLSLMIIERMPRMAVTQVIQRIINDTQISNSFVGVNYRFLMSELYCIYYNNIRIYTKHGILL